MDVEANIKSGKYNVNYRVQSAYEIEKELVQDIKQNFKGTFNEIQVKLTEAKTLASQRHAEQRKENAKLREQAMFQFKSDLEEELGVQHHPKKDKLYDLASNYGGGSGLHDIANYYWEMADLIKE